MLVVTSASGETVRIPMARHLADPVFGAALTEVREEGSYHVEYGVEQTRDFRISVFDLPALERADAALEFPGYTGLTNQSIRDTRRLSAVEGTRLSYTLRLNKPVAAARLIGTNHSLSLAVQTNAVALLNDLTLTNTTRYLLTLMDAEGRTNKFPDEFVLQVLPNRRPLLKLAFPRGDQRVSPLQELQLQAEAGDDFGLLEYGLGFAMAGQEPQFVTLGQSAPANEKRQFNHLVPLEDLGAKPDQVVSYFAWADDYGPDGQVRRTFGDVFFAEVRPFDEIFRRDQSGMEGNQGANQGGQQGGPAGARLAELQKQILIATWKLQQGRQAAPTKP
jgi:hypothetical protein